MQNPPPQLSLIPHFQALPDPRVPRSQAHELIDRLVISRGTLLCGGESFNDLEDFGLARFEGFKSFLSLRHGIPSHDPFTRVFAALDPQACGACFIRWTPSLRQAVAPESVALDGRALRRALHADPSVKEVVRAWAEPNGRGLGQWKGADQSHEITAVSERLRVLELAGGIVTVDAMGSQKQIAPAIIEADADYVLALKGNQETVPEEVKTFLDAALAEGSAARPAGAELTQGAATLAVLATRAKDHGRLETRRYYQSTELNGFADRTKWAGLQSVGLVEARREVGGKRTVERRYDLSSLALDGATFARALRGHWGVENQRHWVLDVWFREDQSRARTGYAAENRATLRRLALNLLKRERTKKRGIKGQQLIAGWDHAGRLRLLGVEI